MGNYNPDAPYILGNEWPGIKDYDLEFSYNNPAAEYGVGFTLPGAQVIGDARVYSHPLDEASQLLSPYLNAQIPLQVNVYPAGQQYDSGPIRRVLIPVTSGQVTGAGNTTVGIVSGISPNTTQFYPGGTASAAQIATAVYGSGIGVSGIQFLVPAGSGPTVNGPDGGGSPFQSFTSLLWFGVDQYSQLLQGKRILDVNVLFQLGAPPGCDVFSTQNFCSMVIQFVIGQALGQGAAITRNGFSFIYSNGNAIPQLQRIRLGEVTPYWSIGSNAQSDALPWTNALIQNFSPNAAVANRFGIAFLRQNGGSGVVYQANTNFSYALSNVALEIIYCEETRVAYGGRSRFDWPFGAQQIIMRTPGTFATSPNLAGGSYVATVAAPTLFDRLTTPTDGVYPPLQALQTYYDLPGHLPVQVNKPVPLIDSLGEQFTVGDPPAVPQITLHDASGNIISASHVYGRRADVPVDSVTTPIQVIETSNTVAGQHYEQIRFYARRWGTADQQLTVSVMNGSATISAQELDALPEIVDGYREVTLPLSQSVTVTGTGTDIQVAWSSPNSPGRRWEILGVMAPALSGIANQNPQSYLVQTPAGSQLGPATYLQGTGATDALSWLATTPPVSGTTLDPITDAVFLLAQSPVQVTGLALTQPAMAVSINAALPDVTDTYSRAVSSGLGSTDTGQAYTTSGGAAGDYNVANGVATISMSAVNSSRWATITAPYADVDLHIAASTPVVPTGGSHFYALTARFVDTNNSYLGRIDFATDGTLALTIRKRIGGVETQLAGGTVAGLLFDPGTVVHVRLQVIGAVAGTAVARARIWIDGTPEPAGWQAWTDGTFNPTADGLTAAGSVGIRTILSSINTNALPVVASFDNFTVTNPLIDQSCGVNPDSTPTAVTYNLLSWANMGITGSGFSYYEVQRNDAFDPAWQTIARIPNQAVTFFRDFEARVGVISSYRIRVANVLQFFGPWSASVAGTIAAPGVSGTDVASGALIFTSNTAQSGVYTLAYVEALGTGAPTETVSFPESGRLKLQWMYGHDDQSAFHPTERGGEQFTRTLLVQNAAVTGPVIQRGFNAIRDMAWAQLPYVCVRNDQGDRWYANVSVASGTFQRNRALQLVQVQVTEVSTTAFAATGA